MTSGHLTLWLLSIASLWVSVTSQSACSVPTWRSELGEDPVASNRGKVVLVALMKGYCHYCVEQTRGLETLKNRLANAGVTDVAMVIVNGGEPHSRNNIANLEGASDLPVIQDNSEHEMFTEIFHGQKDDFVVYDRCGQRAAFIPRPYSHLGYTVTQRILVAVHRGRHSCHCSLDSPTPDPHDTMQGDQPAGGPSGPSYGIINGASGSDGNGNGDELEITCPRNDRWCRRYMRNLRRNNLGRSRARFSNRPRFVRLQRDRTQAAAGQGVLGALVEGVLESGGGEQLRPGQGSRWGAQQWINGRRRGARGHHRRGRGRGRHHQSRQGGQGSAYGTAA